MLWSSRPLNKFEVKLESAFAESSRGEARGLSSACRDHGVGLLWSQWAQTVPESQGTAFVYATPN